MTNIDIGLKDLNLTEILAIAEGNGAIRVDRLLTNELLDTLPKKVKAGKVEASTY
jgi:hypothetical protein